VVVLRLRQVAEAIVSFYRTRRCAWVETSAVAPAHMAVAASRQLSEANLPATATGRADPTRRLHGWHWAAFACDNIPDTNPAFRFQPVWATQGRVEPVGRLRYVSCFAADASTWGQRASAALRTGRRTRAIKAGLYPRTHRGNSDGCPHPHSTRPSRRILPG
jgi:hypothetical protein